MFADWVRRSKRFGLPAWLSVGLLLVTALAVYSLLAREETAAVVATALATVLLALFTAQLYAAAVAQLRASSRPVLVEVKPYAPRRLTSAAGGTR